MGLAEDTPVFLLGGGCCTCFWLIFTLVCLPLSFVSLPQGKYALRLSWSTQQVTEEPVVEPGRYFVGLGNMLVEFPSTMQSMYFANIPRRHITDDDGNEIESDMIEVYRPPMRARSADGLEMHVSLSFQWMIDPDAILPLYRILKHDGFYDEFVRFARMAIIRACSTYAAEEFFVSRLIITQRMLQYMNEEFNKPEDGMKITITGLQLREVDLPNQFDAEIANTQEQMQEINIAQAEREERIIVKERETLVATEEVNAAIQRAEGKAQEILIENEAEVYQLMNFQRRQAEANAQVLRQFENATNPFESLFETMEIRAIDTHDATKLLLKV